MAVIMEDIKCRILEFRSKEAPVIRSLLYVGVQFCVMFIFILNLFFH